METLKLRTGDPELAREINRALILHLLRNHDMIPRAEIARRLHLSKVTVSVIISDLIDSEHVVEVGHGSSPEKGGRRPIMLSLDTSNKYVVGVDLGTTNTVAAVGNLKGELLTKRRIQTSKNHDIENISKQVSSLIHETIEASGVGEEKITGVVMAVAGQVEKERGLVIFSPHFNWHDVPIASLVEHQTGFRTIADNCTRVMTVGELWYGRSRGVSNLLFINVGHGIGSALVIDGKLYNHHSEFGHIFVTKKKIRCACGKYGCLEVVASGEAIERRANECMDVEKSGWITARSVAERAAIGDSTAKKIFSEAGRYLGRGISILANSINPEKIIIGGGISLAGDILLKPVLKEYYSNVMDVIRTRTDVQLSSFKMDAGVMGAVAVALNDYIFDYDIVSNQRVNGVIG